MIKKLLRFVAFVAGILGVIGLGVALMPLGVYLLFSLVIGSIGGATDGGKLISQGIRIFWLILAMGIYGLVGWSFDPANYYRSNGFLFVIPSEWIRWAGMVACVIFFMLFGGLESGDEDPLAERGEEA